MSRFFNRLINAKAVSGFSSIGNLLLMLQINTAKRKRYSRGGTDEAASHFFKQILQQRTCECNDACKNCVTGCIMALLLLLHCDGSTYFEIRH